MNFEQAIRLWSDKGMCIEERHGNYRAYISRDGSKCNVGTYDRYSEALENLYDTRIQNFIDAVSAYDLNPYDGVEVVEGYIMFPTRDIFNLRGHHMKLVKNFYGHETVKMAGTTWYVDTLYEKCFMK